MPTWKEQLQKIKDLRTRRLANDEALYSSGINLSKASTILRKVSQKETTRQATEAELDAIRKKIAKLKEGSNQLNNELNLTKHLELTIKTNIDQIESLEKKSDSVRSDITRVMNQLVNEQKRINSDQNKILAFQNQLDQLNKTAKEAQSNLEAARGHQEIWKDAQQQADVKKKLINNNLNKISDEIKVLQSDLDMKVKGGQVSVETAQQNKKALEENKLSTKADWILSVKSLQTEIEGIYTDPHPRTAIGNLDDSIPFLLLPVRIETRFMTTGASQELWLRIYPDDIAIHTHEKNLTDQEVNEGEIYWKALFSAEKNAGDKEGKKKVAWTRLVVLFGSQRSAWVIKQTKPVNWSNITSVANESQLTFPVHVLTKTDAWTRAPRTNVMPDKFVVMLYEGRSIVKEQVGNIIPDELFIGPDPLDGETAFKTSDDGLVFGETFDWTSNFEKSVEIGMGFKIPISADQSARGFDRILVLGVYLSADEISTKETVEALIDNHHYSEKGFSFINQGTPTNNTDHRVSGFTKNDSFQSNSYSVETGDPLFTDSDDCDGKNLANALGIQYTVLQHILNSNLTDYKEAVAMNTALYPSTLGYYLDTMLQPVLDEQTQSILRDFFLQYISGRGSLPSIRIGNQPYGVLLTSDFSNWKWQIDEPIWGTSFLNKLYNILNTYYATWKNMLNDLAYVGKEGADPSDVLMNILGLQPGSVSFYQRTAFSTDDLLNRDDFVYGGRYYKDLQNTFTTKSALLTFLSSFGYVAKGPDGKLRIPQLLHLVYQHYNALLDAANLVDNVPLSETEPITRYDGQKNYINWLIETNSVSALEEQNFGVEGKSPTSLLYLQLRRSLLLELSKATVKWFNESNILLDQVLKPVNFHNIKSTATITKWEVMKAKVGNALPTHSQKDMAVGDYLLKETKNEQVAKFLDEMKKALNVLKDMPTSRLERCFTEHIDICSYRLDAWQSGLFHQRIQKQRAIQNDGERKKGIYLGAFGWLDNVRPGGQKNVAQSVPDKLQPVDKPLFEYAENGGFVHTPSINHALAAAVLRSGYLNHATTDHPDTMAVNLSSERVRRALFILDGIRNGQSLEALLGYQFERGLHDRGSQNNDLKKLNGYIYLFRDAFPNQQHFIQQRGSQSSASTIVANNVVNGLTLAESTLPFPYGSAIKHTDITPALQAAVEEEKSRLDDSLDAIKDLLLSESVYQLVQGNFDRTAAVMNAMKDAHVPPELDIINTPRSSQFTFTNRVTIQFELLKPEVEGYNPWPSVQMTARAKMEPGLNKWLKKILGEAENLSCLVSHKNMQSVETFEEVTIDKINLQPIDLIYITGNELNTGEKGSQGEGNTGASELESRIAFYYRQLKHLDDNTQVRIQFMEPRNAAGKKPLGSILPLLRMLKSLIIDSRNVDATDFLSPSKDSTDKNNAKGYDDAELLARVKEAQTALHKAYTNLNAINISTILNGNTVTTTLENFFNQLDTSHQSLQAINVTFKNANVIPLQNILMAIAGFGISDAFPHVSVKFSAANKTILLEQARNIHRRVKVTLEKAAGFISEASLPGTDVENKIQKLVQGGKALMGDEFNILPAFKYQNEDDIQKSNEDRATLFKYATDQLKMKFVADEWLQNVSHVHPKLERWEYIRTLYETFNNDILELKPIQLPYRANDSWLAVEFPSEYEPGVPFNIIHDTLSLTVHAAPACFTDTLQSGLLIDDWTETIPVKEEITGITFNYNQPNAMAPQCLLLAVPSQETGHWSWDELVGILNDTLLRAKLRAVEPDMLDKVNKPELGVLLPAVLANFSDTDLDLALDYRMNLPFFLESMPIHFIKS
jgi:hypothetical protein